MKFKLLFIAALVFAFSSCKKDDVELVISGHVIDADGNTPLSGVTVKLSVDDKHNEVETDENGFFEFDDQSMGMYTLTMSKDGYGTIIKDMGAFPENYNGSSLNVSKYYTLNKFNKSLETRILYPVNGYDKNLPIPSVDYRIELGEQYLNNIITGKTDSEGKIVVNNLPDEYVTLYVEFESDEYSYSLSSDYSNGQVILPGNEQSFYYLSRTSNSNTIMLTASNLFGEEATFVDDFPVNENMTFTFNEAIDATNPFTNVHLFKNGGTEVAVEYSLGNNNKTLNVDPIGGSLVAGTYYQLSIDVRFEDATYSRTIGFETAGGLEPEALAKVTGLQLVSPYAITSNYTTNVSMVFNSVENANEYQIYGRYTGMDEFVFLTSAYNYYNEEYVNVSLSLAYLPGIEIPSDGLFSNDNKYEIIVRATNGNRLGDFSNVYTLQKEN